ncbi:SipW-dependent-type signal peptide-containing protein [Rhodococcus marinonascens]|uniref:SipW-dependent-type signal peptide-containing protein n=1 Tax=Rhodococcus marinonascens TaxID=38311 RepID=UPI000932EE6C|nr:SipW-dependent-type signal peptide-containing protein [Rhodococcus marinonascens]
MSRQEVSSSASGFGARARSLMSGSKPRAVASLGIVLGLGAIGTLAAWSDTATATSGVFSTGSIDLQIDGEQGNPYAFTEWSLSGLLPGERSSAKLPVTNTGSAPLTYTISAAASSSDVAPYMVFVLKDGDPGASGNKCSGDTLGPVTWMEKGGSVEALDGPRTLGPGESENVCFQIRLHPDAKDTAGTNNSVEGKSVDVSFNFNATTA